MKNMIKCASLAVLGAASLQGVYAQASSTQTTKPWSVSASLRGFYDDNYSTAHSDLVDVNGNNLKRDSFGFELSPSAALNLFRDQTTFGLSYRYGMKWFEDRRNNSADHSHEANIKLSHAFTPKYKLDVSDSFVVAQEPDLLNPTSGPVTTLIRTDGSNIRNDGRISFSAGLTERFEAVLGYNNVYWDFEDGGHPGSYSALLDRDEHLFSLNTRFTVQPSTIAILGYQYGINDYMSKDPLAVGSAFTGDSRDSTTHYVYAGVDHTFNPNLNASLRAGAQYTEYDNIPGNPDTVSPYAEGGISYTYRQGSYASLNVRHSKGATAVVGFGTTTPTLDAESTLAQISVNHQITARLNATALIGYQHSEFYFDGVSNNPTENYMFGMLALSYEINKFLAAEAGYNYDRVDSDQAFRSFTRNRVYIGIRASY